MRRKTVALGTALLALLASAPAAQDLSRQPQAPPPTAAGARHIDALEDAAAQERAEADEKARSAALARLTAGLEHSEWAVRVRAAELLAGARDHERANALLIVAAGRIGNDLQQRLRALPKAPPQPTPQPPDADPMAGLEKITAHTREVLSIGTKLLEETGGATTFTSTLRRLFLGWPPDQRRRGLLALQRSFPSYDPQLLQPLLDVMDAEVIVAVADMHAATSNVVQQAKAASDKAKRQKPQPNPWATKHREAWEAKEARRLRDEAGRHQVALEASQKQLAAFDDDIAAFAARSNWPAPPRNATPAAFRAWTTQVGKLVSGSPAK